MTSKDNGWSEFGGYMNAKIQKLDDQFLKGQKKQLSNIFKGISIYIDGYTNPSDYKLKELMQFHGGQFCQYYFKGTVSHIIANTLPKSKVDKLRNEKIVTPGWIVDSVNAGRLLNWTDYQLYSDRYNSDQSMMDTFVIPVDNDYENDTGAISIKEYYSKSRLHHLSMWAHQLNAYLQSLKAEESEDCLGFPYRKEFLDYFHSLPDQEVEIITGPLLMHVDMDCFFVSVGIRDNPDLKGCPVVVTHSNKGPGPGLSTDDSMAAVASSSYEARKYGIKNGMLLGKAKTLCPNLCTINYQFDQYLEVSKSLYRTMSRFTHEIEVGSCDELYVNLVDILVLSRNNDTPNEVTIISPVLFAKYIRAIIKTDTQCPCSCGIGSNLLACKLATKSAKPDGIFWLKGDAIEEQIREINVRDMPGIGRVLEEKLNGMSITTFGDLQKLTLTKLQSTFGMKTAKKLFDNSRGKDDRVLQVDKQRKSISAEINYGIRLSSMDECENFFKKLSIEISTRLKEAGMIGSHLTLKIMTRHPDASVESAKYLGHGFCENFSKSAKLQKSTNDESIIYRFSIDLFKQLKKDVKELRGVGLTMQKLQEFSPGIVMNKGKGKIVDFFTKKPNKEDTQLTQSYSSEEDDCVITDVILRESPVVEKSSLKSDKVKGKSKPTPSNQMTLDKMINKTSRPTDHVLRTADKDDHDKTKAYLATLGHTSLDKLNSALIDWIQYENEPLKEDFVLMRDQMVAMVPDNVSAVHHLLMSLKNTVQLKDCEDPSGRLWHQCCQRIIDDVQTVCLELFGENIDLS